MSNVKLNVCILVALAAIAGITLGVAWPAIRRGSKLESVQQTKDEVVAWITYDSQEHGFTVKYPSDVFAVVSTGSKLPSDYGSRYESVKLIVADNLQKLGKQECIYGSRSSPVTCAAETEPGIELLTVNSPVALVTMDINPSEANREIVAGREAIVYRIGAEGAGRDFYFIPVADTRTLVAIRVYEYGGFPPVPLVKSILDTLTVK